MKLIIRPNEKHSMYHIKKLISSLIERNEYDIYNKGGSSFGVRSLDVDGQDFIKTIVVKKCEQYGLEYEIID